MGTETITYWLWGIFAAIGLLLIGGALWWWLRRDPRALLVLSFEKIGAPLSPCRDKKKWYASHKLQQKLLTLKNRGFSFVTPGDLTHLPEKPVWLTFMGGYRSFYKEVFPFLQTHHIPATLFLIPDAIDHYNYWQDPHQEPWQDILTSKDLKILQKSDLISFGAAPLDGKDISSLSEEDSLFLLSESIARCKQVLNLPVTAATIWPAKGENAALAPALQKELKLPLVALTPHTNPLPLNTLLFQSFSPKEHPFKTWRAQHRQR